MTHAQTWDYENRLSSVTVHGETTTFTYDGNGALVKRQTAVHTTRYVGVHYEVQLGTAQTVTPLNYGVACLDNATGTGYLLYSHVVT